MYIPCITLSKSKSWESEIAAYSLCKLTANSGTTFSTFNMAAVFSSRITTPVGLPFFFCYNSLSMAVMNFSSMQHSSARSSTRTRVMLSTLKIRAWILRTDGSYRSTLHNIAQDSKPQVARTLMSENPPIHWLPGLYPGVKAARPRGSSHHHIVPWVLYAVLCDVCYCIVLYCSVFYCVRYKVYLFDYIRLTFWYYVINLSFIIRDICYDIMGWFKRPLLAFRHLMILLFWIVN